MVSVRLEFLGENIRRKVKRSEKETASIVAHGVSGGARDLASELLQRGRERLRVSGNFGSARWQQGLHVEAEPKYGALTNAKIDMWHDVPYAHIHETGGIIRGKPLLWIPLSFADVPKGMYARDYPGGLFRVNRPGKAPLLFSRASGEPKYFGKEQVTIPARWGLSALANELMRNFETYYEQNKTRRGR